MDKRYRNESGVLQLVQMDGEYTRVAPGETIVADERSQVPSIQGFVLVNDAPKKKEADTNTDEADTTANSEKNTGLSGNDNNTPVEAQRTNRTNRR